MSKKILFLMPLLVLALTSCTESEDKCSNADNVNLAECRKDIPDITDRPLALDIKFKDTYFYDQNSAEFKVITKANLEGGIVGMTVPIYSNFLNIASQAALPRVNMAADHFARPGIYPRSEYNNIPYLEVEYEQGVDYIYNYVKKDLNNNIVFEKTGQMIVYQGRAFLPLINEMFSSQFYASATQVGSRFLHSIAIAAQSKDKRGNITATVEFESILQIPNTDFRVEYSNGTKNYTLKNRWSTYYKNDTDGLANDNFHFVSLKEIKDISEQIPLDIKVVFQEPPKIKMEQEAFFEMPLDLDAVRATNKVIPSRGSAFYVQRGDFDSDLDFRMKLRMNGQFVTLTSQREFQVLNLPPGTPWDIDVFYDFNQNAAYDGLNGKPLLTPLKPMCNQLDNSIFNPLQEIRERTTALNSGGYLAVCHPQLNSKLIIPAEQVSTTDYELSDTWDDFYSYLPLDTYGEAPTLGHLYGLRRVTFKMEGCLRVLVRQPGTSNWEIKSKGSAACDLEGETSGGWVYFYAEKTATIFDYIPNTEGVPGLKSLLQFFGSRPVRQTINFKFNGDVNNNRHLY